MNLKDAVAVAKQHIGDLFAADAPRDMRLEEYLFDDHLGVWSLTIGFALNSAQLRNYKIVRVAQADKSVLSIRDRP
jgi:hypothetical protein